MNDDRALIARVLSGDKGAFRQLIRENEKLVSHMVGRLIDRNEDREELCQDVFLKVYEKIGEFGFQSKLSTWIATIAWRHSINHLRRKKIMLSEIPDEDRFERHFISSENPAESLEDQDTNEMVLKLIEWLPVQYKTILSLYHLDNLSYPEIGEITGMPEGTVKSYLFRARNLLKEKVKHYLDKEQLS
jgi:RNA polymerase sigma factor (sigma-70 family)